MCRRNIVESLCRAGASKDLIAAVYLGDLKVVREILEKPTPPVTIWEAGYYLARHALLNKGKTMAELLITNLAGLLKDQKVSKADLLHFAVSKGHDEMIKMLISEDVNVFTRNSCGRTPLHSAVISEEMRSIDLLLSLGASLDDKDDDGYTPIHHAVMGGNPFVFTMVLARKFNVDLKNKNGLLDRTLKLLYSKVMDEILQIEYLRKKDKEHALRDAVCGEGRRCKIIVKSFLKHGFDLSPEDANDHRFVLAAVEKGYLKIVEALLKLGADVNRMYRSKLYKNRRMTLLHLAACSGKRDIAELLISYNADVNAKDKSNITPVHDAVKNKDLKMVELFVANGAVVKDQQLLFIATSRNCKGIVHLLLEHGVDINDRDRHGRTAMHLAIDNFAYNRRTDDIVMGRADLESAGGIVKVLLDHSPDINLADDYGMTPLHLCALNGLVELYKSLVQRGADIHAKLIDGSTMLHLAVKKYNTDLIKIVLNSDIDVNSTDLHGDTPLHVALRRKSSEIVVLLLEHEADIRATNKNGSTPLHLAAMFGLDDVCRLLVKKGADVNSISNKGSTPLHLAVKSGHADIVDFLCDSAAELDITDKNGNTALHFAAKGRMHNIVEYLISRGSDVNILNGSHKTPFQEARCRRNRFTYPRNRF